MNSNKGVLLKTQFYNKIELYEYLSEKVRVDKNTGDLVIENGLARIVLKKDGTILLFGERIRQEARKELLIQAATIDLN